MFYQLIFMLRRYDSSSNECLYVVTGEMCWSVALSSIIILILSFIAYETFENTYIISCHLRGRHSAASIRSLSIKYPPFSYHQSSCQTILSLYFYIDQYIFSIWHQLLLSLLYSFLHNFSPLALLRIRGGENLNVQRPPEKRYLMEKSGLATKENVDSG